MSETPECLVMFSVRGAAVSACFFFASKALREVTLFRAPLRRYLAQ